MASMVIDSLLWSNYLYVFVIVRIVANNKVIMSLLYSPLDFECMRILAFICKKKNNKCHKIILLISGSDLQLNIITAGSYEPHLKVYRLLYTGFNSRIMTTFFENLKESSSILLDPSTTPMKQSFISSIFMA